MPWRSWLLVENVFGKVDITMSKYHSFREVNTSSVPISKHSFDFIFVFKCKSFFKLLDAFIIFFLNVSLINTTILS